MRASTSWSAHFSAFGGSDTANVNMATFSDAMDANKSNMEKINNLIKEEDTVALVKGKNGQINALFTTELKFAPSLNPLSYCLGSTSKPDHKRFEPNHISKGNRTPKSRRHLESHNNQQVEKFGESSNISLCCNSIRDSLQINSKTIKQMGGAGGETTPTVQSQL
jgi:hypothetical protein